MNGNNNTNYIDTIFGKINQLEQNTYQIEQLNDSNLFLVKNNPNIIAKWVNKRELVASYITGNKCKFGSYYIGAHIIGYYFNETKNDENGENYMMFMEKINGKLLFDISKEICDKKKENKENCYDIKKIEENISASLKFLLNTCRIHHKDFHNYNIIIEENDNVRIIDYSPVLIGDEIENIKIDELFKSNMYSIFRKEDYKPEWRKKIENDQKERLAKKIEELKKKGLEKKGLEKNPPSGGKRKSRRARRRGSKKNRTNKRRKTNKKTKMKRRKATKRRSNKRRRR